MIKIESKQGKIGQERAGKRKPSRRRSADVKQGTGASCAGPLTSPPRPMSGVLTGMSALLNTSGVRGLVFGELGKVIVRVTTQEVADGLPKDCDGRVVEALVIGVD